jgi:2-(1,2-epoxy-1,2-dihydrophenyl)acetyl-CoA isomerase
MSFIRVTRDNGIVTLTFNRPEVFNAIDLEMSRQMKALCPQLAEDDGARVLILRGEGRAFLAGGDVQSFAGPIESVRESLVENIQGLHAFIRTLRALPIPVLASVQGAAAGSGLSVMLASDFCIAAADAKFTFAYRKLGSSPDGGATHFVTRLVGARRAAELVLWRDQFTAAEAKAEGLINWVVEPERLEQETRNIAERLAGNSRSAFAATKRLLQRAYHTSLDEQLDDELQSFMTCASGPDFAEGVNAFLEKRKPDFVRA